MSVGGGAGAILRAMGEPWEILVADVTGRHPDVVLSKMFGVPCLKRNGKVVACAWKGGGLTVKLVDQGVREGALALAGAELFDPGMGRRMKEWVLVPATHRERWDDLVEDALAALP